MVGNIRSSMMELCHKHNVDVVEQCRVCPPPGSVVSPASLPLTFFDLIWLSFPPVQRLFIYEFHGSKAEFLDTILPNLKHSLSLTLQHFFPLAGKLAWPENSTKPVILYTEGDSVAFTVTQADSYDFSQVSGNHQRDANLFVPLIPELIKNYNNSETRAYPVLALQVTLFPDKGICIGVTYHHSVADGRSLIHFVKSWASICRSHHHQSFLTTEPLLYCDRSLVKDPMGIDMTLLNNHFKKANITKDSFNLSNNHAIPTQDKVAATFVIRPSDVKRIKHWVLTRVANVNEPPLYLSTFVLTCAYVWVCLIKARWGEATVEDLTEYLLFPIDCRVRQNPPLPTTYFGNCLVGTVIKASRSELTSQDGIAVAAELIGNAIQTKDDGAGTLKIMEILSSKDVSSAKDRFLAVAGSTKLGIYETNFGWGKLNKAEVASIASSGAMSLCECPDEEGAVEVGLVRNKIEMDVFTSLSTKILEAFP